jgi:hypothetical protein
MSWHVVLAEWVGAHGESGTLQEGMKGSENVEVVVPVQTVTLE